MLHHLQMQMVDEGRGKDGGAKEEAVKNGGEEVN